MRGGCEVGGGCWERPTGFTSSSLTAPGRRGRGLPCVPQNVTVMATLAANETPVAGGSRFLHGIRSAPAARDRS